VYAMYVFNVYARVSSELECKSVRRTFHSAHAFVNGPLCSAAKLYCRQLLFTVHSQQFTKAFTKNSDRTRFCTSSCLRYPISGKNTNRNIAPDEISYSERSIRVHIHASSLWDLCDCKTDKRQSLEV
jgi:hypothetical protein